VAEQTVSGKITLTDTINWVNHPVRIAIRHATGVASQLGGILATA
jgi:hypothetical protein